MQLLLNKEADIYSCDKYRETPFHKASKVGHNSIAQLLLNNDVDNSFCGLFEEDSLHKANEEGHFTR